MRKLRKALSALIGVATIVVALAAVTRSASASSAAGLSKIKHIVVIMQENRSFDSYFGTFPGADGIPMKQGTPTVCAPDTAHGTCTKPYVDHRDVNGAALTVWVRSGQT